jgi:hypothetical protein
VRIRHQRRWGRKRQWTRRTWLMWLVKLCAALLWIAAIISGIAAAVQLFDRFFN